MQSVGQRGTLLTARNLFAAAQGHAMPCLLPLLPLLCRCGACRGAYRVSQAEVLRRLNLAVDCLGAKWVRYLIMVSGGPSGCWVLASE